MQQLMHEPSAELAHLVRNFQTYEELHTETNSEHRLFPGTLVGLCFFQGDIWFERGGALVPAAAPGHVDFWRTPGRMVALGSTRIVSVELPLWGAVRLFGMDFERELRRVASDPDVIERIVRPLSHGDDGQALHALQQLILQRARTVDVAPTPAMQVAAQLCAAPDDGQLAIAELAETVNLSVRQLERLFRDQTGLTPKQLARLSRFEHACERLWRAPRTRLTTLAHQLGFADSAHFSREFRAFAGISPGAYSNELAARG